MDSLSEPTYKSSNVFGKLLDKEETTLVDILNDDDFLSEIRIHNENLLNYLNHERIKEMISMLLEEPSIGNTSIKSFKIPFIICEVFCMDIEHFTTHLLSPENDYDLFITLLSYFTQPVSALDVGRLNQTLACYVAKIVTFLWLKKPNEALECLAMHQETVVKMAEHLYLTECVADMLVKFVCLRAKDTDRLRVLQQQIMVVIIRSLDSREKADQALETFKGMLSLNFINFFNILW